MRNMASVYTVFPHIRNALHAAKDRLQTSATPLITNISTSTNIGLELILQVRVAVSSSNAVDN